MDTDSSKIYIGTVALEPTRWGRRQPSFAVSEWIPRFEADGFEGIELWEFHYLAASEDERKRLVDLKGALPVYNSYVGFGDDEAVARAASAEAIHQLRAQAVKYNVGGDAAREAEYRRNVLTWAGALPETCRLLCECHPGTVLEDLDTAVAFFADLDPERYGVIAHTSGDAAGLDAWFKAFGDRTQHMHVQMRGPETDPRVPENRAPFEACLEVCKSHGYTGSWCIEFSRGIGRDEDIEEIYANACADMRFIREGLQ